MAASINENDMTFSKYKQNLSYEFPHVLSYGTRVAKVEGENLLQLGWWSVTTQKHINFAASELGLNLIKS